MKRSGSFGTGPTPASVPGSTVDSEPPATAPLCVIREAGITVDSFNVLLKLIYGPTYRKTYKRVYECGRLRKRRV